MNLRLLDTRRRYHTCTVCGRVDVWGPSWSWYGSLKDEEDGTVAKVCSDKCKADFEASVGGDTHDR